MPDAVLPLLASVRTRVRAAPNPACIAISVMETLAMESGSGQQ